MLEFYFFYFIIWIVIGAWVVSDCRDRGGSSGDQIGIFIGILLLNIIALILWLLFRPKKKNEKIAIEKKENNLEILKKRYAKGEINEKEYKKIKKELE